MPKCRPQNSMGVSDAQSRILEFTLAQILSRERKCGFIVVENEVSIKADKKDRLKIRSNSTLLIEI